MMAAPPPGSGRPERRVTYTSLFRLRDWILVVPLAIAALLLAVWGFSQCPECHVNDVATQFGRALAMLKPTFQYQHPWQLVVAQFLIPALALFGGIKLLLFNLRRDMRVALARQRRNHLIVCGLGDTGRQIVENLRADGIDVVAVVLDNDETNATACERLRVPILQGDATRLGMLSLAGLKHARGVVVTTGSDAVNIEVALRVDVELGPRGARRPVYVLPEVRSAWLLELLHTHPTTTLGSEAVEIRPFDLYANAVRLVMQSPNFRRALPTGGACLRPHLLVAGLGEMGTQLILQAAQSNFAVPGCRLAVTVFDQQGEGAAASIAARFPGLRGLIDLEFVQTSFDADNPASWPEVWSDVEAMLRREDAALMTVAVIVSLKEDKDSLHTALQLRGRLDRLGKYGTPVFVRLRQQRALGRFAAGLDGPNTLIDRLIPFGDLGLLTSPELLIDQAQDGLARAIHATYLASLGDNPRGNAAVPWSRLPERFKQSNRAVADHLPAKLGLVRMRLVPGAGPAAAFTDGEVETMAAAEHWRWTVERRAVGWTQGPRDDVGRVHPDLVPWEDLSERLRQDNCGRIRAIPQDIAPAGLTIRRERVIDATGPGIAAAAAALDAVGVDEVAIVVFDPLESESWRFACSAAACGARLWLLWREGSRVPPAAPAAVPAAVRDAVEAAISARELEGF